MKKLLGLTAFFCLGASLLFAQGNDEAQTKEMMKKLMSDSTLMKGGNSDLSSLMKNMFTACTIEPTYSFTNEIVADMYSVGKKPKDSFSMRQIIFINSSKNVMGMEMHSNSKKLGGVPMAKSIINLKDSCIIMLMDQGDEKTAMSMKIPQEQSKNSDSTFKMKPPVKTGKSKMILGVLCYEYLSENTDSKMQMWVDEKEANLWDAFSKGNQGMPAPSISIQGMPLEMVMNNLKEGSTIFYFVRSINKNKANTINTAAYKKY